ncbi:SOS response-associated peptidase [Vibrio maritimus]
MCGRLNIIDDPFSHYVSEQLGIVFSAQPREEAFPSESLECVVAGYDKQLFQLPLAWGIKPTWSNKLIINAQAETVQTKPTFSHAYSTHRAIVPCSGWYEWKTEPNGTKSKYLFQSEHDRPLYMAAVGYPDAGQVVTLTTEPTDSYKMFHHRMPLILSAEDAACWLLPSSTNHTGLLSRLVDDTYWKVIAIG